MNTKKGVLARSIAIVILICICATAVLYVDGVFEFSFIDRHHHTGTEAPSAVTTFPNISTQPPYVDTTGGDSVYETSGVPEDSTTEETSKSDESETGGYIGDDTDSGSLDPDRFSPPGVSDYIADGYKVTYEKYLPGMVLCEVVLPNKFSDQLFGKKFFRESGEAYIYSDETFVFGDMYMKEADRLTVETYMGYILIATEGTVSVYDVSGNLLFVTDQPLSPAYTRDKQDRPLYFIDKTETFYYIDFELQSIVLAEDYDDDYDNRGLYFNYNPDYGKSDIGLEPYWEYKEFTRYFGTDMGSSWQKLNVSPLIAKELQLMYPKYAALVARVNLRFAAALKEAQKEIAEEEAKREEESKRAEEESKKAEEAASGSDSVTDPVSPSESLSGTLTSPPEESGTAVETDTLVPVEITVIETLVSPEDGITSESFSDSTSSELSPERVSSPDVTDSTDVNPSTDTSTETLTSPETETDSSPSEGTDSDTVFPDGSESVTEPEETKPQFPSDATTGYITIEKHCYLPRYGFGYSADKLSVTYQYARAFAFVDGRACVIDDDGRLTFLNTRFRTAITKYRRFKKQLPDGESAVWYVSSFYEPIYKDMRSLGSYYFDSGYVTVRHVDLESMRNKRAGYDETYLIDTNGNRIYPPSGFNFVSCSEGIMLVERDGRYGYYDVKNSAWIADPIYTYAEPFYEGVGVVGTNGGFGAIDKNGNEVLPLEFDYVSSMSTGLISVYSAEHGWQVFAKMAK